MRLFAGWLYALGLVATLGGVIVWVSNIPDIPDEDDLVWKRGYLIGILLDYDYDGLHIVNMRLRGEETLYTYHSIYPSYVSVRDRIGIYRDVEVLVDETAETAGAETVRMWGVIEHDPYDEGISVSFDEIRAEVTQTERSWQRVALVVLAAGLSAILAGFAIRRAVPYVPKDPTA
ncbi:MAG: hypothetical protein J4G15_12060 [Alphaproteobacteria bacterium]|nr:hypothetical protein [Alphaproteobacteria bacterium]